MQRFTKKELELHNQQSLEDYKRLVEQEARKRLSKNGVVELNVSHLRQIRNKDNFELDVTTLVDETLMYL